MEALTRKEKILDGQDLTPVTRKEYFLKKAVSEGGGGGADIYIGKMLSMDDVPALPEGYTMADVYEGSHYNAVPIYVSDGSSTLKCLATYPNMQEEKPAIVTRSGADGMSVAVPNCIYYSDPEYILNPLIEDSSQNSAYLTLNTAVSPIMIDYGGGGSSDIDAIFTIDKNNLKWILVDVGR